MERYRAITKWAEEIFSTCSELIEILCYPVTDTSRITVRTGNFMSRGYIYETHKIELPLLPDNTMSLRIEEWQELERKYQTLKNDIEKIKNLFAGKESANIYLDLQIKETKNQTEEISFDVQPYKMRPGIITLYLYPHNKENFLNIDKLIEYVESKIEWLQEDIPEKRWNEWHLPLEELEKSTDIKENINIRKINIKEV